MASPRTQRPCPSREHGAALVLAIFVLPIGTMLRQLVPFGRWTVLVLATGLIFSAPIGMHRIIDRFGDDPLADARLPMGRNTFVAARDYMPFGSGLGTFVPVYGSYEKPRDMLASYANRAHDDVLEFWLETGAAGLALMLLFAIWLISSRCERASPCGATDFRSR